MKFGEEEKITAWKAVESWHLHFVLWRQLMNHCIQQMKFSAVKHHRHTYKFCFN
jgi:hypothetical protein